VNDSVQKLLRALLLAVAAVGAQVPIVEATTIVPEPNNGSTVWTGNNPAELTAAGIGAIVGEPGLASFYEAGFGNARIAIDQGDQQVVFTAVQSGIAGHDITVRFVNSGAANSALSVSVAGRAITVSFATNSAGASTSTAAQIAAAVNAHPGSGVVASTPGAGNGVPGVTSGALPLAPVIVEAGSFASSYETMFSDSASFPQDASVAYGGGAAITASSLFLYVRDTAQSPAFYIYDLLAPAFSWNGLGSLLLDGFWPGDGAIEQLKIVGVASTSTPVPVGSSLALLALALGALAWSRSRYAALRSLRSGLSSTFTQPDSRRSNAL